MTATPDARPTVDGLLDALALGVCAVDARGVIIEVNHAWTTLTCGAVAEGGGAVGGAGGAVGGAGGAVPRQGGPAARADTACGPPMVGQRFADWAAAATPEWSEALTGVARLLASALRGEPVDVHLEQDVGAGATRRELDLGVRRLDQTMRSGACVLVTVQDLDPVMQAHHHSPQEREERQRLELVVRYSDSAIAVLDLDGVIEWVSDSFVALTGFSRADAIGCRRWDLVRGPFAGTEAFTRFEAEVEAGRPASVEAPLHRPDGTLYWVSWAVQPMYRDGRIVKLLSIQRDITKRRRAEEMARLTLIRAQRLGAELRQEKHLVSSVLATVPTGVWWKDAERTYLGCNQAYATLRGLDTTAEVIGRKELQLPVADVFGPQLDELEQRVLSGGDPVSHQRITIAEPGQSMQTFLLSVLPRIENRQTVGVLGVCTDVSQIAELERQLSQTSRLESIGQLAAGIAHEINTPVQYASDNVRFVTDSFQSIFGALQSLQAISGECTEPATKARITTLLDELDLEFLAEEVPSALAQSHEGLDRVAQIVRAMKEFSHPGGERTPTDINHLVESTIQVSRNEWKYVSQMEQDLATDIGEIPCYAGDLKQALLNILVNAAHAIEERRRVQGVEELGLLSVSTRRTGDEIVIAVGDDGIGMADDVRRRIFDPFFTTKGVGKGTGQGLSLAHSAIVTKHQGRIEVSSEPMKGTVFSIVLPIPQVSAAETEPATGPGVGSDASPSPEAIG